MAYQRINIWAARHTASGRIAYLVGIFTGTAYVGIDGARGSFGEIALFTDSQSARQAAEIRYGYRSHVAHAALALGAGYEQIAAQNS